MTNLCGKTDNWFGPLSERLTCGLPEGHEGICVHFQCDASIGFWPPDKPKIKTAA